MRSDCRRSLVSKLYLHNDYVRARDELSIRGVEGKSAFECLILAEAAASSGKTIDLPRTKNGELRIRKARKYDLPYFFRLVTLPVSGGKCAFLFVGSHDAEERWVEHHKGYEWSEQDLATGSTIAELYAQLPARTQELKRKAKANADAEARLAQEEDRVVRRKNDVEEKERKVNDEFETLAVLKAESGPDNSDFRAKQEELDARRREVASERESINRESAEIHERAQKERAVRCSLEKELQSTRQTLDWLSNYSKQLEERTNTADAARITAEATAKHRSRLSVGLAAGLGVSLLILAIMLAIVVLREKPNPATTNLPANTKSHLTAAEFQRWIAPTEAEKWEGKTATVRLTVRSSRELPKVFLINSEGDYTDPSNFSVVVWTDSAGLKYKTLGISNLRDYFKIGTVIRVTGKVDSNPKSKTKQFQIKVDDPGQIERE